jgi:DNA-binding LacI/PurR family transcriptional regulator
VGLVLARPARLLGVEPFFMELIGGMEECLAARDMPVLLHVVATLEAECATYRRWARSGLVEAVTVVNQVTDDPRPALLRELGIPFVLVGSGGPDDCAPCVRTEDTGPVRDALSHLLELGHRHIARISGPTELLHTQARTRALLDGCRAVGLDPQLVAGDYSEESGARLTTRLLQSGTPPTAILYDNDVMAVAGLAAARELGVTVPDRLSLIAWDDSTLCWLSSPALTAMSVDVHQLGVLVAETVLELVDGAPITSRWAPAARYSPRGTTAPCRFSPAPAPDPRTGRH